MLNLSPVTAKLINDELMSVPEHYHKPFNSMHEALGIIREEYVELELEIFFGEKKTLAEIKVRDKEFNTGEKIDLKELARKVHREKIKKEAIQVAAMCARLIQEL